MLRLWLLFKGWWAPSSWCLFLLLCWIQELVLLKIYLLNSYIFLASLHPFSSSLDGQWFVLGCCRGGSCCFGCMAAGRWLLELGSNFDFVNVTVCYCKRLVLQAETCYRARFDGEHSLPSCNWAFLRYLISVLLVTLSFKRKILDYISLQKTTCDSVSAMLWSRTKKPWFMCRTLALLLRVSRLTGTHAPPIPTWITVPASQWHTWCLKFSKYLCDAKCVVLNNTVLCNLE